MTARVLPYGRQSIDEADVAAVAAVLRGDWLTTGPAVDAFEAALAERVDSPHAVVCSSGTAALHMATAALGLGPGDSVVVPAVTFVATANAPRLCGCEILFADVDPETGLMGPAELEAALARDEAGTVRAVFPVHMNGQAADMSGLGEIARRRGLKLVEDASHAVGGSYSDSDKNSRPVGASTESDATVFSFHPVKTIAMGEGGAVTSRDAEIAARARRFRNHGLTRAPAEFVDRELGFDTDGTPNPWYYEMHEPGLNYRASDIHCALGLSQLGKLDAFVARRRALAERYDARLTALAPTIMPVRREGWTESAWHLYVALIDFEALGKSRAAVMARLRESGILTQVHYMPVHLQPYYRERYGALSLPGAEHYYARCLSLPLFPAMAPDDVDRVADALAAIVAN